MSDVGLPPCGLYRTVAPVGTIPEGRLVYFHNHGDPGPGLYLPESWKGNRARFGDKGTLLPDPSDASALEPLEPEGFYRVVEAFHCCEKRCRLFEPEWLVQLGYDGGGTPILFVPELVDGAVALPDRGTRIDRDRLSRMARLRIRVASGPDVVH